MKHIVIIGASGLGKEIKTIIDDINEVTALWNIKGFYDDAFVEEKEISSGIQIKGTIQHLIDTTSSETAVVFGIADRKVVQSIYRKLQVNDNFTFPNIIHPSIKLYDGVSLGTGNVLAFGTFLSCDVKVGDFNFFNSFVAIGHDATIGNFNCLMPRTQISGGVQIQDYNFFGMSSAIVQYKTMGSNNIINAYTLLTKSIKDDRKYFGIPGKRIDN